MTTKKDAGLPEWVDPDDAPVLTATDAQTVEVFHGDAFIGRGRNQPPMTDGKELVSIRLGRDVLARLRTAGPGWQSQVDALLRWGLDHSDGAGATPVGIESEHMTSSSTARAEQTNP